MIFAVDKNYTLYKSLIHFPASSWDVTNKTLPGRE